MSFLGIGAQKAATSWLHYQLARHPQVWFPAVKELHFWDRREGRPARAWLEHFEADAPPDVLQGEITPAYALLDEEVVREIAALSPGLRIFYCLRDPADRAWSALRMEFERNGRSPSEASEDELRSELLSDDSLQHGDYAAALRCWQKVFGPALKVLWYDEVERDPRRVLVSLAEHLGVDAAYFEKLPDELLQQRVFRGAAHPLPPKLRSELADRYREPVREVGELLGVDLSHWCRAEAPS